MRGSQPRWKDALVSMVLRKTQRCGCSILLILAAVSGPLAGCSPQHVADPTPVSTTTITISVTPTPTPSPAATAIPSPREARPSSVAPPVVSTEVLTDADPGQYWDRHHSAGYFFVSPSKNLSCGFLPSPGGQFTGCQTEIKVSNFPPCEAPMSSAVPAISFQGGERATAYCINQGAFVGGDSKVLPYGQRLTVGGVTCTSRRTGVTCIDQKTGHGFTAAREGFTPFG